MVYWEELLIMRNGKNKSGGKNFDKIYQNVLNEFISHPPTSSEAEFIDIIRRKIVIKNDSNNDTNPIQPIHNLKRSSSKPSNYQLTQRIIRKHEEDKIQRKKSIFTRKGDKYERSNSRYLSGYSHKS